MSVYWLRWGDLSRALTAVWSVGVLVSSHIWGVEYDTLLNEILQRLKIPNWSRVMQGSLRGATVPHRDGLLKNKAASFDDITPLLRPLYRG